jgi:hypothetical protein
MGKMPMLRGLDVAGVEKFHAVYNEWRSAHFPPRLYAIPHNKSVMEMSYPCHWRHI